MRQLPLWQEPKPSIGPPPRKIFALVDANNFYVSVERTFNASIKNRPVVVLGNGDGCVVARSNEAKRLGITMGMPLFRCRPLVERYHIAVFSSNYPLYQDMSNRMMRLLAEWSKGTEIFSIDEAFLNLSHIPDVALPAYGEQMKSQVEQWTGIPVTVGIASSKVLAKLACEQAKGNSTYRGVLSFVGMPAAELDEVLSQTLVEDLFGVGERLAARLNAAGILTARRLKEADHVWLRHLLGVNIQRVVLELRGISCWPLETEAKARQTMMVSQSFGRPIESLEELLEAIAHYSVRMGEKLRRHHHQASRLAVFIRTNPFDRKASQYARGAEVSLRLPTANTPDLIAASQRLVRQIYQAGYSYKKAGVSVSGLRPEEVIQPDLFGEFSWPREAQCASLMAIIDVINDRFGRDTVFWGAQGLHREWQMRQRRRSPHFTTRWQDILPVT